MLATLRRVIQEVNGAADLQSALDIIVHRVKQAMEADVCSVYLRDPRDDSHVLMATDGYNPDSVGWVRLGPSQGLVGLAAERAEPVNVEDAPGHPRYRFSVDTGEAPYHGFLGVPIIQHREVLGVLVVRQRAKRVFAEQEVTFLVTLAAQLAGAITHAEASGGVRRLLQEMAGDAFSLRGLAGAPGVALGRAVVFYPPANLDAIPDRAADDPAAEEAGFRAATAAVREDMRQFSRNLDGALPPEDRALFDAYVMMLSGDTLVERTVELIRAGNWAPGALRDTIAEHVRIFEDMDDPYLSERAEDIRDLGRRLLLHLQSERPSPREWPEHTILVGEELSASQLAEVPGDRLAAVVSARGSSSSHVAILARALDIPAVMGVEDLPAGRLEGQELVVDGYQGRVYVKPSATVRTEFQRLIRQEARLTEELRGLASLPAETPDGIRVPLYVNTGLLSDISPSLRSGTDGVGLYRTEIPFLIRDRFPGEEEQRGIYRQVLESFAPRPVTLRTLDVGGDKPLPYFPVREDNPFLGWRGIRITLDHPEIFLTQLRAILRANTGLDNLRLLLPMISGVGELDEALRLIRRAHEELLEEGELVTLPPIGVMIEVPSAVYQIDALARRVDFFSVGTNDLTQYLLAVDRNNARVAELYDALHPAVLQALRQVVDGARRHGKSVSVCGEMAGDPAAALLLLGMGVDSLSMSVGSLARVKWVVRTFTHAQAAALLARVWELEEPAAIRRLVHQTLEEAGLGGLVRAGG
ncbi:MAG TPA: phosphoenolpyruvate--protein phosphotransferase [Gammaproteobacteria bacterium]|nr:phosphoenolpyruvate--protein phosphotransferase [Gammaproteobacteria bacterium]